MRIKEHSIQLLLFCGILCFTVLLSQRIYLRIDATQQKTYTLSAYTKAILDKADNTVTITWFKSYNADGYIPALQYVESFLHEYEIYAPNRCIVLQKDTATLSEQSLAKLGFAARQIEQTHKNTRMLHTIYSGLLCEYRGKSRVIPFMADIYTLESDIARFIIEMDQDARNRSDERLLYVAMPPAGSNNQIRESPYRYVLPWIEYAGFIPVVLPPSFTELKPEIPLLVIGSDYFDAPMLTALDVFLQKNGSAAFFVSANTVNVHGNWEAQPKPDNGLDTILRRFGFELQHNLLMDPVNFLLTLPSSDNSRYTHINYPFWPQILHNATAETAYETAGIPKASIRTAAQFPTLIPFGKHIQLFWPSSLSLSADRGRTVFPVLVSSPKTAVQLPPYNTNPYETRSSASAASTPYNAYCIAGAGIGVGKGRIFTAADEYCLSTAIEYTNSDANLDFMVNVLHWIAGQDALLQVKQKQPGIAPFRYFEDEATFSRLVFFARMVTLVFIPMLAVIGGITAHIYKKKHEMG
ncbi:MAG: GldG family protein [Treponema sp.]